MVVAPSNRFADRFGDVENNMDKIGAPVKHVERSLLAFERVCSIPPAKMHSAIEENSKTKKVNVIVKVVSATGIHIQDCSKSKKGFLTKESASRSLDKKRSSMIPPTTITASLSSSRENPYHWASFPFHFASSSNVINWSQQDDTCTFFNFQREWLQNEQEDDTIRLKTPCIVNLSVTRAGKKFILGRAEFWGDRVGEHYIDIPIINEISTRKLRFRKGMKLKTVNTEEHSFKYGLGSNATLRVAIIVSEPFYEDPETALVKPSYLQYTVPPSRLGSPVRVRSIKKSVSDSTDYYTNSTDSMSSDSRQSTSPDWGTEVQYKLIRAPIHSPTSHEVVSSSDEDSLDSYVSAGSDYFVSSLGEKYNNRLNWRHLFICNFPDCGIDDGAGHHDTFVIDDELSCSSSFETW